MDKFRKSLDTFLSKYKTSTQDILYNYDNDWIKGNYLKKKNSCVITNKKNLLDGTKSNISAFMVENCHFKYWDTDNLNNLCKSYYDFTKSLIFKNCSFDFCNFEFVKHIRYINCSFNGCSGIHYSYDNYFLCCNLLTTAISADNTVLDSCLLKDVHFFRCDKICIKRSVLTSEVTFVEVTDSKIESSDIKGFERCTYNNCLISLNDCGSDPQYNGLPDGSFIGWKMVHIMDKGVKKYILCKLLILSTSLRSKEEGLLCRADKVKVIHFEDFNGKVLNIKEATTNYWGKFIYTKGKIVYADSFDKDRYAEFVPHGIYFFIDRQAAIDYYLENR